MGRFFTRERFGYPQFLAGFLLLLFLTQCLCLVRRAAPLPENESAETFRVVQEGLWQWRGGAIAGTPSSIRESFGFPVPAELRQNQGYDPNHSPLWYLLASSPFAMWPDPPALDSLGVIYWVWLARLPSLVFGLLLGASLWYVSRRLYGNSGGYVALALYCFSPGIIRSSSLWFAQPEMGAAWGAFGAIFTAIAVAHTLYAPREVVLWNWRRILLLGLSLSLAIGSQFSLIVVVPVALAFMLYLAPTRRRAALAIWGSACAVALLWLYAACFFRFSAFAASLSHGSFVVFTGKSFLMPGAYRELLGQLRQSCPALVIAFPSTLVIFLVWPRTRYFGNTAPLLIALLFLVLSLGAPHYPGLGFQLMAVPFLFVFVAGVISDLLETQQRALAMACVWGLLSANALWNLWELARAGRG
jgi:hypothetical protein